MQPSPNFRSMVPQQQQRGASVLGGLTSPGPQAWGAAPPVPGILPTPPVSQEPAQQPPQMAGTPPVTSPSRASFLNQPAQTQWAKSSIWASPSARPPSVTESLLDNADASVAANMPAGYPPMNLPPVEDPAVANEISDDVAAPPPLDIEFVGGGDGMFPGVPIPEYIQPSAYMPLQPSRRYEVL
jgi:hypothetical protein